MPESITVSKQNPRFLPRRGRCPEGAEGAFPGHAWTRIPPPRHRRYSPLRGEKQDASLRGLIPGLLDCPERDVDAHDLVAALGEHECVLAGATAAVQHGGRDLTRIRHLGQHLLGPTQIPGGPIVLVVAIPFGAGGPLVAGPHVPIVGVGQESRRDLFDSTRFLRAASAATRWLPVCIATGLSAGSYRTTWRRAAKRPFSRKG